MRRKTVKASDYTNSVWSGKKYDRLQTQDDLTAESLNILRRHPTIGRLMAPRNNIEAVKRSIEE